MWIHDRTKCRDKMIHQDVFFKLAYFNLILGGFEPKYYILLSCKKTKKQKSLHVMNSLLNWRAIFHLFSIFYLTAGSLLVLLSKVPDDFPPGNSNSLFAGLSGTFDFERSSTFWKCMVLHNFSLLSIPYLLSFWSHHSLVSLVLTAPKVFNLFSSFL